MLYDPVIFKDIFIDKTGFSGWNLNAAPNFFPDMFLYFILMGISGNFIIANFLFSILQYILILLLVLWIFRQFDLERSWTNATIFNYLMFAVILLPVFTNRVHFTFQILSISYHIGSYIMFLLSLNLLFMYLRKRRYYYLLLIFISCALGSMNDRLYISQFILACAPLLILFIRKAHRKELLLPFIILFLGTIGGILLFRMIRFSDGITIIGTDFKMFNFGNMLNSWNTFWHYMYVFLAKKIPENLVLVAGLTGWLLAVIWLLKNWKENFFSRNDPSNRIQFYLILILAIHIPLTLLMPVLNGAFLSPSIIRMNVMALYSGLIIFPMSLSVWQPKKVKENYILKIFAPAFSLLFLFLFSFKVISSDPGKGLRDYFTYYPAEAQCLDELKDEHDLKYGIGNYWYAKYLSMFSKNDIRLYSVHDHTLKPFYHSTNQNWYHPGGKGKYQDPVFNFILKEIKIQSDVLNNTFGSNLDTLYLNEKKNIVIIKVPDFIIDRDNREIHLLNTEE